MNVSNSSLLIAVALSDGVMRVQFNEPQRAVTPGQTVVIYQGDEVLGAGRISGAELPC